MRILNAKIIEKNVSIFNYIFKCVLLGPYRKCGLWASVCSRTRWYNFPDWFWGKESSTELWSSWQPGSQLQVDILYSWFFLSFKNSFYWKPDSPSEYYNVSNHFYIFVSWFFLRWLRNGTEIDLESDYRYSLIDGTFIISNPSEAKDAGYYQCLAANTFGSILSREAILQFACE